MGKRVCVDVGMGATEDRAVGLGGCRRPLGRGSVRHSAGFLVFKEAVDISGVGVEA
jgi:hypothetical protein